jgi:hypothetical protein
MLEFVCKFCVVTSEIAKNIQKNSSLFFSTILFPVFYFCLSLFFLVPLLFCYNILILNTENVLFQHVISENVAGEIPRENPDDLELLICC